jgi:hypothetical protein
VASKGYDALIIQVNQLLSMDRAMVATLNTVLAKQKDRIFGDGKASNESKIGSYGTKPISISRKNQSKQTGKTYFKGGYKEYKGLTGKGNAFVNLRNTDQMRMDYTVHVLGKNEWGLGFSNEFNANKAEWNEEKYGKLIFETSDSEDDLFDRILQFELDRIP